MNRGAGFISLENLLFFSKTFTVRSRVFSLIGHGIHSYIQFTSTELSVWFILSGLLLQTSFQRLLKKQGGKRAAWEYPFAVAGVNITFMIMQMLDLEACKWKISIFPSEFGLTHHVHLDKLQHFYTLKLNFTSPAFRSTNSDLYSSQKFVTLRTLLMQAIFILQQNQGHLWDQFSCRCCQVRAFEASTASQ